MNMFTLKNQYRKFPALFPTAWVLLASAIFLMDLVVPLGVADGMLYVVLVLGGLLAGERRLIIGGAILGTVLIVAGLFLSPPGLELWKVLVNRFLSVFTIWMTAFLCTLQNHSENKLSDAHSLLEKRVRERTAQLDETNRLLQEKASFVRLHKDIAVAVNEPQSIRNTIEYCLKRICRYARWPVGHLYLVDSPSSSRLVSSTLWHLDHPKKFETFRTISEDTAFIPGVGLPGRVLASGEPAWIIDVTQDPNFPRARLAQDIGVKAGFAFPILIGQEVAGIMEFFSTEAEEPRNEMLEIMGHIGTHLGRAIEKKRAEEKMEQSRQTLRNLYHRLEMVREEERTRIAREFHDELAQVLTTLKIELSLLHKKLGDGPASLQSNTQLMLDLIDATIPAVKQLILDLRPPVLDNLGLQEAIMWQGKEFERRMHILCEFNMIEDELSLDPARSTTLFRIFQETLTNVARHAQAKKVLVKLSTMNNIVTLRVQDDGIGILPEQISDGHSLGILGMQERARVWGGTVEFESPPHQGTTISVNINRS